MLNSQNHCGFTNIASRLREARKTKGYSTFHQFAAEAKVSPVTYISHESARSEPNIHQLAMYAKQLEIPLYWLLYGSTDLEQHPEGTLMPDEIQPNYQIGKRILIARKAFGYETREKFAKAMQMTANAIRAHEIGEANIKISTLLKYQAHLKISLMWLLTGKSEPVIHNSTDFLVGYQKAINGLSDYYSARKIE